MFIRIDPDAWHPDKGDREVTHRLQPGQIVVWQRRPYRLHELRAQNPANWPEKHGEAWLADGMPEAATWWRRPIVVILHHLDDETAKPVHLLASAGASWYVLPEHFSICRLCHELPPCTHVHTEAVMARASERLEKEMAILPGVCHHCREPITSRQKSVYFAGPNLIRPDLGDGSAVFHLRASCRYALERYDKRWAEVTGGKRRYYCEGHQTVHLDKTVSCTELADCPGDVSHRSREWHHAEHQGIGRGCWCLAGDTAGQLVLGEDGAS